MNAENVAYTPTAQVLHWLMAVLILGMLGLGVYMTDLKLSPTKLQLYAWHKWIGITLLLLAVARLAWRLTHPAPPLPDSVPAWQRRAAHGLHGLLYVLLLAIPLSGWLMSSAKGFQTVWWGVLPLPDLVTKDEDLGRLLADIHGGLNLILATLLLPHVAAALKHHFIDRDPVLARMLPWAGRRMP
jgi:cytochrome b561